jgi:hypothetical protein
MSVRGTVTSYLRRAPTRAEITAARRAAHALLQADKPRSSALDRQDPMADVEAHI